MEHITVCLRDGDRFRTREVLEVDLVAEKQYRLLHSPAFV